MRISEVPPHAWSDTLDAFTAAHEGWLVSIATFGGADEEPRTEIANLPLIGISADRSDHVLRLDDQPRCAPGQMSRAHRPDVTGAALRLATISRAGLVFSRSL